MNTMNSEKYGKKCGLGHSFCHSFRGLEGISVVKSVAQATAFATVFQGPEWGLTPKENKRRKPKISVFK